jgi:putative transposase
MQGRQPPPLELDDKTRQALKEYTRRRLTPQQLVLRARIVLLAADGKTNAEIGREMSVTVDMARLWRDRWRSFAGIPMEELSIDERLEDAPRPGAPAKFSAEQICQIVALACEAPEQSGRPISQWTGRELADEVIRKGIVETISPRHVGRLLKRGISSHIAFVTG